MAMGGYKGNYGSRGRPYALMLLLAFGAALFGVVVVHKFREKGIFNLLIKEKDRDILSLQHLLQKERDRTNEMKKKTEVMRVKIYSLRSQKMELENTIREMQSTISSLREEQRMLESALEENQKEIRMLRENDSGKNNSQEAYLDGMLKQKEAEIEELKRQLEMRVKLGWEQSFDRSSYQQVNSTSASSEKPKRESEIMDIGKKNMLSNSTVASNDGDQSVDMVIEDGTKLKTEEGAVKVVEVIDKMDLTLKSQKQGSNSDENPGDHGTADQSNSTKVQGANNYESKNNESQEHDGKNPNGENAVLDAEGTSSDKQENGDVQTMGTEEVRRKNLEEDKKVERQTTQAGSGKLESQLSNISSSNGSSSSSTAKSMFASAGKKKGKKWKVIARKWRVEHKAASKANDTVFVKDGISNGDAIQTENREVRGARLSKLTGRSRYHDQSHLSKANKSNQTEDGMQEISQLVEQDDRVKEDSDRSEFKSKGASSEELMNGEIRRKLEEDMRGINKSSDSSDGKLLKFKTYKMTEDLKGIAVDVVQQDQAEKGDITSEKSSDSNKVELPMNRRFNGNQGDNLTGEIEKPKSDVGIRQRLEEEANAIQDERNKPEA